MDALAARRWGARALAAVWCLAITLPAAALDQVALPASARAQTVTPAPPGPLSYAVSASAATRDLSTRPVAPVPAGYVGVSMDYCQISKYTGTVANPILAHLLLALAPSGPVIRIGGDELGTSCAHEPPVLELDPPIISALARRTNAKLILGIDFVSQDPSLVEPEVSTLLRAIDPTSPYPRIEAFEIGNEPDLYPDFGPTVSPPDTRPYFEKYLSTFNQWANLIRYAADDEGIGIAGPSLGRFGLPWITGTNAGDFEQLADESGHPTMITFHTYALLGTVRCPSQTCPSIENLLSDHSSAGLANGLAPFANQLAPGEQLRVDEMNSVTSGGVAGVSNTFASALWMLDTLFEMASVGVDGVNVHSLPGAAYELFTFSRASTGDWEAFVHPDYYGMLMFTQAFPTGARLLPVDAPAGPVKVWATLAPDGHTRVTLINQDSRPHRVELQLPPTTAPAELEWLRAPSVTAPSGVTLGGQTFGLETATGQLAAPALQPVSQLLGTYSIELPAYSAALLTR